LKKLKILDRLLCCANNNDTIKFYDIGIREQLESMKMELEEMRRGFFEEKKGKDNLLLTSRNLGRFFSSRLMQV
jgi:hypothetical protein